jgi:hypothetical protein
VNVGSGIAFLQGGTFTARAVFVDPFIGHQTAFDRISVGVGPRWPVGVFTEASASGWVHDGLLCNAYQLVSNFAAWFTVAAEVVRELSPVRGVACVSANPVTM